MLAAGKEKTKHPIIIKSFSVISSNVKTKIKFFNKKGGGKKEFKSAAEFLQEHLSIKNIEIEFTSYFTTWKGPLLPGSPRLNQSEPWGEVRQYVLIDFGCICAERNIYLPLKIKVATGAGGIKERGRDWAQNTSTR